MPQEEGPSIVVPFKQTKGHVSTQPPLPHYDMSPPSLHYPITGSDFTCVNPPITSRQHNCLA